VYKRLSQNMGRPLLFVATDLHGYTQTTAKDRIRALFSDLRDQEQSFRCKNVYYFLTLS